MGQTDEGNSGVVSSSSREEKYYVRCPTDDTKRGTGGQLVTASEKLFPTECRLFSAVLSQLAC